MKNPELVQYIKNELEQGKSDLLIKESLLKEGGWSEQNIMKAFRNVYYRGSLISIILALISISAIVGLYGSMTIMFFAVLVLPIMSFSLPVMGAFLLKPFILTDGSFKKKLIFYLFAGVIAVLCLILENIFLLSFFILTFIIVGIFLSIKGLRTGVSVAPRSFSWFSLLLLLIIVLPLFVYFLKFLYGDVIHTLDTYGHL